jgi:hypothetical protein
MLSTWAQAPGPIADAAGIERERIAAERESAMRRFDAEEAACSQRFAVTPCVDGVRERRRAALAAWREQELRLDEAERRERARRRLEEIAARAAAVASASATSLPQDGAAGPRAAAASAGVPAASASSAGASKAPADSAAAPRRAQAARQRRQDADEARRRIEEREADRAARGRVTAPLPVPPGANSPVRP